MKNFFTIILAFLTFGFTSCKKDSNLSEISSKGSDVAFSSKKDASLTGRVITASSAQCEYSPQQRINHQQFGSITLDRFTIVASFPSSKAQPNVILPKGSWFNDNFKLVNQDDGNLVLYRTTPSGYTVLWASQVTYNQNPTFKLQTDLNFVAYNSSGTGIWDTGTYIYYCTPNSYTDPNFLPPVSLILSTTGELMIARYEGPVPNTLANEQLWTVFASTRTMGGVVSPNNGYFFRY